MVGNDPNFFLSMVLDLFDFMIIMFVIDSQREQMIRPYTLIYTYNRIPSHVVGSIIPHPRIYYPKSKPSNQHIVSLFWKKLQNFYWEMYLGAYSKLYSYIHIPFYQEEMKNDPK